MKNVSYLLKNKKFKELLKEYIKYPKISVEDDIRYISDPKSFSLIGHAYEILFQIEYLKINKLKEIHIIKSFRKISLLKKFKNITDDENIDRIDSILKKLEKIEKSINRYIDSKKEISSKDILYLAAIGNIREIKDLNIKKIKKRDIDDIEELRNSLKRKGLKKILNKKISFNRTFEKEDTVGEIDILGKDFIIDIKTTISGKVDKTMINQLVLYYLISQNGIVNVKKVGILFSRYGKVLMFKIRDLISKEDEKKLLEFI